MSKVKVKVTCPGVKVTGRCLLELEGEQGHFVRVDENRLGFRVVAAGLKLAFYLVRLGTKRGQAAVIDQIPYLCTTLKPLFRTRLQK